MKNFKPSPSLLGILAAAIFSTQSLPAATPIWSATGDGNWSANGNWSTGVIPQPADDVQFGDAGAGSVNTMDTAFTIDSLTYNQGNGSTHTTVLNPGLTLNVNRSDTNNVISVGSTAGETTASTLVPVVMQGAGATLSLNGTGDIVVRQGNSGSGSHMATLDLSAVDIFNANVGRLLIGQAQATVSVNRPSGTLYLAKTNTLKFSGAASPQVIVQDSGSNANGGTVSWLYFGQVNNIYADQFRLGGQKGNGNVQFNNAFSNPSLVIRNTDTTSRAGQIAFADNSIAPSGNSSVATADFSAGSVDILADTVYVARGNAGGSTSTGQATATVTIGAGTFDINTLEIGFQTAAGPNGATTGTLNVNNNNIVTTNATSGLVSTGAVLVVNTSLRIARTNGGTGAVAGTLSVNGGTVLAGSIVAGGGNSTINLNAGSLLVVSNNAGTLANPIRNLNVNDAAMTLPAQNAGGVVAVSNLVTGGANTVNISSIPPIGSYPATFTLVSYKAGSTGTFTLGTLPQATPSYAGTLVDTGNGVIQLQLNTGPTVDLSIAWTAAANNFWDTTSVNWTSHSNPTNFFAGATPTFDDTAAQTAVLLATPISSGTVTVNNSTKPYQFTGSANIVGASSLVKNGAQTLTIDNSGVDSFGSVTVNGGTLQIGTGDVNGEISSLNITNNASIVVNRSGPLEMSSAIAGTGSLTKQGNGTLTLSGASTYSGATTLSSGGLEIDGSLAGNGAINTASGTVLSGLGTVAGPVTVAGAFNPGRINGTGTFTGNGAMTFSSGGTLTFDLSGANPSASDTVALTGGLNLNNNAVTANFIGVPQIGSTYTLFTYGGSLSGNFNPNVVGTHYTVALDTSAPGVVNLTVTGGSGANLKWTGATDSTWDSTVANWADAVSATPSLFYSGDSVLLDDTATANSTLTIGPGLSVYPASITNNSDTVNFTINGPGKISGTASVVKMGASTLTISNANDFTGPVDIQAGTLKVGSSTALGNSAGQTTVESGATLDVNGQPMGGETIIASGMGVGGAGAIINSGSLQNTALRSVTLAGDTAFGGTGTWAINNSGGAGTLLTSGQPFKLTKVGPNQVGLQNLATVDAALGDIEVQQGTLEFNGLTASMGDATHTNTVDAGATEQFASDSVVWQKHFILNGNGTSNTINNGTAATTEFAGPTELHGAVLFNIGGTSFTISGDISGDGGIVKNGSSPMILTGNNTFTGDTLIRVGALRVGGNATILSSNITILAGATLTATGRVDGTFTLNANQTLSGNGVVAGQLVTLAGSTLSPGTNGVGALTVSNAVALGGTNSFDLDQDNKTNDVLNVNAGITYGGTLNLTTLTSALTNGATFKLFKALSYGGAFTSITPATPGSGLTWNTAGLSSGIIGVTNNGVVTGPTTNASITSVKMVGGNIVIHGTNNNVPNTSFKWVVLTSTNLTLPLSSWTPVATNPFTAGGVFDYTAPIGTTAPRLFYDVKVIP